MVGEQEQMLISMLQFLSSSTADQLRFLDTFDAEGGSGRVWNEMGEVTDNALLYYISAMYELTDRRAFGPPGDEFRELVLAISAILGMLIGHRREHPFIWYLDKSKARVSGDLDRVWVALRHLAKSALALRNIPSAPPSIAISEIDWNGSRIRG